MIFILILVSEAPALADTYSFNVGKVLFTKIIYLPNRIRELRKVDFNVTISLTVLGDGGNGDFQFSPDLRSYVNLVGAPIFGVSVKNHLSDFEALGDCSTVLENYCICKSIVAYSEGVTSKSSLSSSLPLDQHGLEVDSSGNYWGLMTPTRPCTHSQPVCGPSTVTKEYIDCQVMNFSPNGTLISKWSASDHLPNSEIRSAKRLDDSFYVGAIADPFHCNSVEDGRVLVSMKHTDSVYVIDQQTGAVICKIGGSYGKGVSLHDQLWMNYRDVMSGQHDLRWVNGNEIFVFDDKTLNEAPAQGLLIIMDWSTSGLRIAMQFRSH